MAVTPERESLFAASTLDAIREARWEALRILSKNGREIKAVEVRQIAALLRDACTLILDEAEAQS